MKPVGNDNINLVWKSFKISWRNRTYNIHTYNLSPGFRHGNIFWILTSSILCGMSQVTVDVTVSLHEGSDLSHELCRLWLESRKRESDCCSSAAWCRIITSAAITPSVTSDTSLLSHVVLAKINQHYILALGRLQGVWHWLHGGGASISVIYYPTKNNCHILTM